MVWFVLLELLYAESYFMDAFGIVMHLFNAHRFFRHVGDFHHRAFYVFEYRSEDFHFQ